MLIFEQMKYTLFIFLVAVFFSATSCKKDAFITSKDALLQLSEDTLHFDTVFTSTGSITQYFKIFNPNNQKLLLSGVELMGGSSSYFKINVDGTPGTVFQNIEIAANDSLYTFVTVSINPSAANLPFVVRDSIRISYNGNVRYMQLEAYGQNAVFLNNREITKDTTWNNTLPIVILGGLVIDSAKTLTINKGCKVYVHADAPIIVNGTVKAIGDKYDSTRIVFQGDRLDDPYKNYPGSWPGIILSSSSKDNVFQYAIIKNAYQGVIAQLPAADNNPKLTLDECILDNIYDVALGAVNSSISARNCLISNCGYNVYLQSGGNYTFNQCTISSYNNDYVTHKNAVFNISNNDATNSYPLNCTVVNSIIYGDGGLVNDEITVNKLGNTAFGIAMNNVLYKVKNDPANIVFSNSIKNQSPLFDSIDVNNHFYNFRLQAGSPCINKGAATSVNFDLDGNTRNTVAPDLGCYETL